MIIVRHPGAGAASVPAQQATPQPQQPMLVVSAATNSQQMQLLQQQNNIRLAPTSSLSRGASPATAPSPRQPVAVGHFMSPRNTLHTTLSGTVLSGQATTSNVDQTMTLAQQAVSQQAGGATVGGYGLNLDLTGLGATQLVRTDGDVTPLTPQDQLSRYVDQL